MKKILFFTLLSCFFYSAFAIEIEKQLIYDKYTLADTFMYNKKVRLFQWEKISHKLDSLQLFLDKYSNFAVLNNYKNFKGIAPLTAEYTSDDYGSIVDMYGVPKTQSIPLYTSDDNATPERYSRDGSLVAIVDESEKFYTVEHPYIGGEWLVPKKYVKIIETIEFPKVIVVDRTNQNIATLELVDTVWLVRSMNPATTGQHKPPHQRSTPLGIFVMQSKMQKMLYYVDGTKEIGGYAPFASRFCCGGYIHGVPVNLPATEIIEYSATLGTTPRSHMCVRNASSHAKFIYDWTNVYETLIFVIE